MKKGKDRIGKLLDLSVDLWYSSPEESLLHAKEALHLSQQHIDDTLKALSLCRIDTCFCFLEQPDYSAFYLLKSLELSKSIGYRSGISIANNNTGLAAGYLDDYDNAINYYLEEVKYSETGILESNQKKLLKLYFQTGATHKLKHQKAGLGLTISKKLVELAQGKIGVKSKINQGSVFWFTARFGIADENSTEKNKGEKQHLWM